jgi:hypothetical protein
MACPHCGNADPSLIERLATVCFCLVCAKGWQMKVPYVKVEARQ